MFEKTVVFKNQNPLDAGGGKSIRGQNAASRSSAMIWSQNGDRTKGRSLVITSDSLIFIEQFCADFNKKF